MARKGAKGYRRYRDTTILAPQPFTRVIDSVCMHDREYFETNSECQGFLREYVHGEFWPLTLTDDIVVAVIPIEPRLTVRMICRKERTGTIVTTGGLVVDDYRKGQR